MFRIKTGSRFFETEFETLEEKTMTKNDIFNSVIDLPRSEYFFTQSVNFWQAIFNILCIFFVAFDAAIEDIFSVFGKKVSSFLNMIAVNVMTQLYPKMCYA